jgi:mRNA interferase MazF
VTAKGSVVLAALPGDYGKPRPAVVVQSDVLADLPSAVLCLVTSELRDADFRVNLPPDGSNGLREESQAMADKLFTLPRSKLGDQIGRLSPAKMRELERALTLVLGLGE